MTRIGRATGLLPLALIASCAVGPDFKQQASPEVARYTAEPLPENTTATPIPGGEAQRFLADKPLPVQWWTLFGSPKLDALVLEALRASPDVASAQAALRVAQENARAQTAQLFPSADAEFSATRQKIDTGSFGNPGGGATIYNLYNASVKVTYGLDLWGGTRRGVEASRAAAEAQAYQLEATYQTLIANVITSAIEEARQRALMIGQHQILENEERLLNITKRQFELGGIGRADLLSAQSNIATERAKLPPYEFALSQAQNQLAVYLGKTPAEHVQSEFNIDDLKLPQEIPLSVPSELVRQRADVRAAEASLHEAAANVGVATANLLPQIGLTASFGTQSSVLDKLFSGNIFSIGGTFTQPIFRAGELTAKRRGAIASYDKAKADYRKTVLLAFQNVADSLRALETDSDTLKAQFEAAQAAEGSLKLTELQYKLGSASHLALLNAQQTFTRARAGYVITQATRFQDTAALFQALGGGWTQRDPALQSPADQPASGASAAGAP